MENGPTGYTNTQKLGVCVEQRSLERQVPGAHAGGVEIVAKLRSAEFDSLVEAGLTEIELPGEYRIPERRR